MLGYTISIFPVDLRPVAAGLARPCGDERWSHRICSTAGLAPTPRFRVGCPALQRGEKAPSLLVYGSTALHGLRPTHGPLPPARDRQLPAGPGLAPLSLWHPRHAGAEYVGRRQRVARLPHFHGHGDGDDRRGAARVAGRCRLETTEDSRLR